MPCVGNADVPFRNIFIGSGNATLVTTHCPNLRPGRLVALIGGMPEQVHGLEFIPVPEKAPACLALSDWITVRSIVQETFNFVRAQLGIRRIFSIRARGETLLRSSPDSHRGLPQHRSNELSLAGRELRAILDQAKKSRAWLGTNGHSSPVSTHGRGTRIIRRALAKLVPNLPAVRPSPRARIRG